MQEEVMDIYDISTFLLGSLWNEEAHMMICIKIYFHLFRAHWWPKVLFSFCYVCGFGGEYLEFAFLFST